MKLLGPSYPNCPIVAEAPLGPVFDSLPLAIRYDIYLRERALTTGTPDWELETWTWRQRNPAG